MCHGGNIGLSAPEALRGKQELSEGGFLWPERLGDPPSLPVWLLPLTLSLIYTQEVFLLTDRDPGGVDL